MLVVRLISLLIFFIFFVFAIGSDHDERSALVLYWIPSFFYLYSMNVLWPDWLQVFSYWFCKLIVEIV